MYAVFSYVHGIHFVNVTEWEGGAAAVLVVGKQGKLGGCFNTSVMSKKLIVVIKKIVLVLVIIRVASYNCYTHRQGNN